jgi:DNA-binding HxlR family transcriptional regulator
VPGVPIPKRHPYHQWSPDTRALDLLGDKWTLLIVRDLTTGPRRFVELQRVLPGISTEQLRSRLNRMVADGILTRTRYREAPPRVDYALTARARALMPVLAQLAIWGLHWAWSEPRPQERVDIGAILRLLPGLVEAGDRVGVVECVVTDGARDGGAFHATLTLAHGACTMEERPADAPAARICGEKLAWIAALSPGASTGALSLSGEQALAERLLDALRAHVRAAAGPEAGAELAH